jgi:hypothetical protein
MLIQSTAYYIGVHGRCCAVAKLLPCQRQDLIETMKHQLGNWERIAATEQQPQQTERKKENHLKFM